MLNMLIAIMGNTFDNVIERKSVFAMQMRLNLLSDYRNIINLIDTENDFNNFIYVVSPIVDEDETEEQTEWEGGFNFLKKALNRKIEMLKRSQQNNS